MLNKERNIANSNDSIMEEIINYGSQSKKSYILENIVPREMADNHIKRRCWLHDLEFYDTAYNCIGVRVADLIGDKNMSLSKACRSLYREIIRLTNDQSGGIGFINFDEDMAAYITDETDEEIGVEVRELFHDLNIHVRKGCEKAYITLNFGLDTTNDGRRFSRIMLEQYELGDSDGRPFIFPNLVFKIKSDVNLNPDDFNYDIFEKSCEVTSKCMIPTYFNCDCSINKQIDPSIIGIMGCRTRVVDNLFGESKSINRGNVASTTINLVQIALESDKDINKFRNILSETMDKSKEHLIHRLETLSKKDNFSYLEDKKIYIDSDKDDTKKMFRNGTLSIGFIGLWDSIEVLFGKEVEKEDILNEYNELAYEIVNFMRNKVDEYIIKENLNFSLLASSAEGVSGEFPSYDKIQYEGNKYIKDKDHYTNSFHVPVNVDISCFEKIVAEANFHKLCNGGAITYIELNEIPSKNTEAIKDLILFAKEKDCSYFGINFPLDKCCECGYTGTIDIGCPLCKGENIFKLRRVSGYLSEVSNFSEGKYSELEERKANKF